MRLSDKEIEEWRRYACSCPGRTETNACRSNEYQKCHWDFCIPWHWKRGIR